MELPVIDPALTGLCARGRARATRLAAAARVTEPEELSQGCHHCDGGTSHAARGQCKPESACAAAPPTSRHCTGAHQAEVQKSEPQPFSEVSNGDFQHSV